MSLYSKKGLIERIRRGKAARAKLVSSNLDKGIAFQIRATRDRQNLTQVDLAAAAGMQQNNLSRLEDENYGKQTISSLKRIAEALDVALVVRLVPFSQYVDWLSGTPFLDRGISPESMAVPSFDEEEEAREYDSNVKYFVVYVSGTSDPVKEAKPALNCGVSEFYSAQIVPQLTEVPYASGGYNTRPNDGERMVS